MNDASTNFLARAERRAGELTRLSVVLITRDQAPFVPRLVESVLAEPGTRGADVVLVDSASRDDTIACACAYPIGVLRLHGSSVLTAAAARRAGTQATHGDAILFLDGDMALCPGWLPEALRMLDSDPAVGCVTGEVVDAHPSAPARPTTGCPGMSSENVRYAGGAALYRRKALERAGGFNPYLHSDEEPELGVRIRAVGYRIVQLPLPIALHFGVAEGSIRALLARRRRNLYLGCGETLRYLVGTPFFWAYVRERGFVLAPALAIAAGICCAVAAAVLRAWLPVLAWLVVIALVLAGDLVRRRSPRHTLHSLVIRLFLVEGMLRGIVGRRLEPSAYPSPEVLQRP